MQSQHIILRQDGKKIMKLWIERNAWGWLGGSQTLPGSRRFNYGANQRRTSRSNFSNWRLNSANWGCKKSLAETLPSWTKCTHLPFSLSLSLSPSSLHSEPEWSNLGVVCRGGPILDTTFVNPSLACSQSSTPISARSCASSTRRRNTLL